jgi:hypothetical protein
VDQPDSNSLCISSWTAANRSVLSADLLGRRGVSPSPPPADLIFHGIGGSSEYVLIDVAPDFASQDGALARVRRQFASCTDRTATDRSILGSDVLNHFVVILSRGNSEILLLAPNHRYRVERNRSCGHENPTLIAWPRRTGPAR